MRYFYYFFSYVFNFNYPWIFMSNCYNFFLQYWHLFQPLFDLYNSNWFLFDGFDLYYFLGDIRSAFLYFSYSFMQHYLFYIFYYLFHLRNFSNNLYQLLNLHCHWNSLFDFFFNYNESFYYFFTRNMHLDWNYHSLLHFNYLLNFHWFGDDALFNNFPWNFNLRLNYLFSNCVNRFDYFPLLNYWNDFLSDYFDSLIDRDFNILDHFNFNNFLLKHRDLHFLNDLYYLLYFHDFLHNPLDNTRNLDYFLNDTRNNHDLFDYLFDFHYCRYFHYLLDYFLHRYTNLFNPFYNSGHFDNALNYYFHRPINIHVFECRFVHLH